MTKYITWIVVFVFLVGGAYILFLQGSGDEKKPDSYNGGVHNVTPDEDKSGNEQNEVTEEVETAIIRAGEVFCEAHSHVCSPMSAWSVSEVTNDTYAIIEMNGKKMLLTKKENGWEASIVSSEENICETGSGSVDLRDYCDTR